MKATILLQAVIILLILALAATSCSFGKEYSNRVFSKPAPPPADSAVTSVRFLEMDDIDNRGELITVSRPAQDPIAVPAKQDSTALPKNGEVTRSKRTRE